MPNAPVPPRHMAVERPERPQFGMAIIHRPGSFVAYLSGGRKTQNIPRGVQTTLASEDKTERK